MLFAGSAVEGSHEQDVNSVDSEETTSDEPQPLQIIPFAGQRSEPPVIDLVRLGADHPLARMTSVMEGISLFGAVPHLVKVLREENSPVILGAHSLPKAPIGSQVPTLEGIPIQGVDSIADVEVQGVESALASAIPMADESKPPCPPFFAYHSLFVYIHVFFFDTSLPYLNSRW